MYVPMDVDHVSGSEPEEGDWKDVDEVRTGSMCYHCWMMGHVARDCRRKGKGKGKGGDGGKGYDKRKRENDESHGKERLRHIWRIQGRIFRRTERLGIPGAVLDVRQGRTQVVRMSMGSRLRRAGRCRQPKKVEDNLNQKKTEKSEECESPGR